MIVTRHLTDPLEHDNKAAADLVVALLGCSTCIKTVFRQVDSVME